MSYQRGDIVRLRAYGDEIIERRVWHVHERGVVICSEEAYRRATSGGDEPLCVGWPPEDVLGLVGQSPAPPTPGADGEG